MCSEASLAEALILGGLIFGFVVFVIAINWRNCRDHQKTMNRMYGPGK